MAKGILKVLLENMQGISQFNKEFCHISKSNGFHRCWVFFAKQFVNRKSKQLNALDIDSDAVFITNSKKLTVWQENLYAQNMKKYPKRAIKIFRDTDLFN